MSGIDMNRFYRILGERLQPLDVENLKFLLADNFRDDQLAELEIGKDVAIMLEKYDMLEEKDDRETFKESLQIIGRKDLVMKLDIYLAAGFARRISMTPGGAAKVLNQGLSQTCTYHALANAIADQLNEHNIDVSQQSLAEKLVNNNKHIRAVWPDIYDNYGQSVLVMDKNSDVWYSINIKTVKRVKKFISGEKHLLTYFSEHGNHCVYIKEQVEDSYNCVNSWGKFDPYQVIPVEDPRNILWTVQVEFQSVSPSNCGVDEARPQENDQDVGTDRVQRTQVVW